LTPTIGVKGPLTSLPGGTAGRIKPVPGQRAAPSLDAEAQAAFVAKSRSLAPSYKTELLPPPGRD